MDKRVSGDKHIFVLKSEKSLASAIKLVYFVAFVYACFDLYHLIKFTHTFDASTEEGKIVSWLLQLTSLFLVFVLSLHHIRLYLTIEMLEDPASKLHRDTIKRMGCIYKTLEQLIRLMVILYVGLKAFYPLHSHPQESSWVLQPSLFLYEKILSHMAHQEVPQANFFKFGIFYFVYLTNIFLLLLTWDIIVWAGREGSVPKRFFESIKLAISDYRYFSSNLKTLHLSHAFGMTICVFYVIFFTLNSDALSTSKPNAEDWIKAISWMVILTLCYLAVFAMDIFKNRDLYWHSMAGFLSNLYAPYYGDECAGECLKKHSTKE